MSKIKIVIRAITGEVIPMAIMEDDLIDEVKDNMRVLMGVPLDKQRLILAGKQIEDGRTLADYNVRDGAELHWLIRL